jgi:hypothetical protein
MQLTNESPGQPPVSFVLNEDEAGTEAAAVTQAHEPVTKHPMNERIGHKQPMRIRNRSETTNENQETVRSSL